MLTAQRATIAMTTVSMVRFFLFTGTDPDAADGGLSDVMF